MQLHRVVHLPTTPLVKAWIEGPAPVRLNSTPPQVDGTPEYIQRQERIFIYLFSFAQSSATTGLMMAHYHLVGHLPLCSWLSITETQTFGWPIVGNLPRVKPYTITTDSVSYPFCPASFLFSLHFSSSLSFVVFILQSSFLSTQKSHPSPLCWIKCFVLSSK